MYKRFGMFFSIRYKCCIVSMYVKWNETKKFYEVFACNGSDTEKFPDHTAVTEVVSE